MYWNNIDSQWRSSVNSNQMWRHGYKCWRKSALSLKTKQLHMDALFFLPLSPPPPPGLPPSHLSHSSCFHWRSGRGDGQHGDHQQPPGAGVSGHWNTCTCHHVRSRPQCTEETMQYSMRSDCKTFFFSYRWYKDGKAVRQGEGLRVSANSRRLIVSRAQVSDTARFQCVASNEAGDHERDFNVVVHGKILGCPH